MVATPASVGPPQAAAQLPAESLDKIVHDVKTQMSQQVNDPQTAVSFLRQLGQELAKLPAEAQAQVVAGLMRPEGQTPTLAQVTALALGQQAMEPPGSHLKEAQKTISALSSFIAGIGYEQMPPALQAAVLQSVQPQLTQVPRAIISAGPGAVFRDGLSLLNRLAKGPQSEQLTGHFAQLLAAAATQEGKVRGLPHMFGPLANDPELGSLARAVLAAANVTGGGAPYPGASVAYPPPEGPPQWSFSLGLGLGLPVFGSSHRHHHHRCRSWTFGHCHRHYWPRTCYVPWYARPAYPHRVVVARPTVGVGVGLNIGGVSVGFGVAAGGRSHHVVASRAPLPPWHHHGGHGIYHPRPLAGTHLAAGAGVHFGRRA